MVSEHGYVTRHNSQTATTDILQMARSRRNLNDSRPQSPSNSSDDEREDRSPQAEPRRGRSGKKSDDLDIEA